MRALERRFARLASVSHTLKGAPLMPQTLHAMAAVAAAECAREKLMNHGPHVPVPDRPGVESEARRRLREKLLPDDPPPAERARA